MEHMKEVYKRAFIEYKGQGGEKGDVTKMLTHLPSIRKANVECYAGHCTNCTTDSLSALGKMPAAGCTSKIYLVLQK